MSTENKQETRLPGSKDSYSRAIMDASNDTVFVHDAATGKILDVNARAEQLFEISRDPLSSLDMAPLTLNEPPYSQADTLAWIHKARTEGPQQFEWKSKSLSGRIIDMNISMRAATISGRELVIVTGRDATENKQAEQLAQSTLDALSAHIAILDQDGIIIAVNQAWEMFAQENGARPEISLNGSNYLAICDAATGKGADDANQFAAGLRSVISGKSDFFEMEYPCETEQQLYWFTARITAFDEIAPRRFAVAHEDITARKIAELNLQKSQDKYKALYDNAPLSYQSLDESGCLKDVNPAWLRLLGYEREEVIGTWFGDYLHPDFEPFFNKQFPILKACGSIHDVQFLIRHKNGSYRRISFEGCADYQPDGSFKQTYCVFTDTTEQHKAIEALKESEENFRALANILPIAIYRFSGPEQTCDYINPTFTKLFGYSLENVPSIEAWWPKAYPDQKYRDEVIEKWTKCREQALATHQPAEPLETVVTCKNRSTKIIQWTYITIGEKNYSYGLDLTAQKRSLQQLEEKNRELERFNRMAVGREMRMIDLKEEINGLCRELGKDQVYNVNHTSTGTSIENT